MCTDPTEGRLEVNVCAHEAPLREDGRLKYALVAL